MLAYDCDDSDQFEQLSGAVTNLGLDSLNLLQAFAPDNLLEARNRGFAPLPENFGDFQTASHG